jgi:hypothetical protein
MPDWDAWGDPLLNDEHSQGLWSGPSGKINHGSRPMSEFELKTPLHTASADRAGWYAEHYSSTYTTCGIADAEGTIVAIATSLGDNDFADEIVTAVNAYSTLQARVAELEKERTNFALAMEALRDMANDFQTQSDNSQDEGEQRVLCMLAELFGKTHKTFCAALQGGSNA